MGMKGWSGLYWARPTRGGDYEIRAAVGEGEGYSYPAEILSKEAFERLYKRIDFLDLVHPQRGLCVMSYSGSHETSNICTFAFEKGARGSRSGTTLQRRFRDAPMPDPSG